MAAHATTTIKLPAPLLADARAEASLMNRSMGSQVEHWALLGRAVERAQRPRVHHLGVDALGRPTTFDQVTLDQLLRNVFAHVRSGYPCGLCLL